MDHLLSWAWTETVVAEMEHQQRLQLDFLDIPVTPKDAALCHLSRLSASPLDPPQISWLWFFENEREALGLRLMPQLVIPGADRLVDLIRETIPADDRITFLQMVPLSFAKSQDYRDAGIHEVWWGFDYKKWVSNTDLSQCTTKLSIDDFQQRLSRIV